MAFAAPRRCSCGRIVPYGVRCECQIARDRARKARHDENRPSARDRGYSTKWDKTRAGYLVKHPRCAKCGAAAAVVDHIQPHRGDPNLFWKRDNWQGLCVRCHSSLKQSEEHQSGSNPLAHPFLDKPPACPVIIVAGAPGSGKTKYVQQRMQPGDVVIDIMEIMARLAGVPVYQGNPSFLKPALEARNALLRSLATPGKYKRAWFIIAEPRPEVREIWRKKLQAELVIMPASLAECITNIWRDPIRTHCAKRHVELARRWFAKAEQHVAENAANFMRWRKDNPSPQRDDDASDFNEVFRHDD